MMELDFVSFELFCNYPACSNRIASDHRSWIARKVWVDLSMVFKGRLEDKKKSLKLKDKEQIPINRDD